ncbi:MAG TPA: hypothetical protein VFD58_10240 [Blastocatellia bacterium]|nr:hypothetical protein [Blastocatellia bacterium]
MAKASSGKGRVSNEQKPGYPPEPKPQPPEKDPRDTNPVDITIRVGGRGKLMVKPERVALNIGARQEARWRTEDGVVEIRFSPNATPFRGNAFRANKGGAALSGVPLRETAKKGPFKYTIYVTTCDGFFIAQGEVAVQ